MFIQPDQFALPCWNTRRMRSVAQFVFAVILLTGGAATAFLFSSDATAADAAPPALSKKVSPLLKAANDALTAKQYDVLLKKLDEAGAVDKLTDYDKFTIDEYRALAYVGQNTNFEEVLSIYEKHLSTPGYLNPQQAEIRPKVIVQIAFRIKDYPKTVEYGKKWVAEHPDDSGVFDLLARAYYVQKDYKNAMDATDAAIALAETAGRPPEEIWLQLIPSCASNLNDQAAIFGGYQKLVRYYPKTEHWSKVLESLLRVEKNDLAVLYVLRLMADTGVLTIKEYYLEYSQRAVEQALPGEALKVLETGFEKKILEGEQSQRALADVRKKAQTDKAQLPEIEKEVRASKATTGQAGAGLGLAYFGYGMYEQAIQVLESSIAKGGLRNLDDYRMALGVSYLRSGQKEKAREQFQTIAANTPLRRISELWVARSYNP